MCVYNVFSLQVYMKWTVQWQIRGGGGGGGGRVVNTNGGELQLIQS